nr:putative glycine cleavage system h protein, mitochondrial [Quercus suber]
MQPHPVSQFKISPNRTTSSAFPGSTQGRRRRRRPLRLPADILDLLQLAAHLDDAVADHAGVEAERAAHHVLGLGARVEAQDEVVALVVDGTLLARRLGQQERAPVRDAAHHAARAQHDVARAARDVLDLVDVASGPDLLRDELERDGVINFFAKSSGTRESRRRSACGVTSAALRSPMREVELPAHATTRISPPPSLLETSRVIMSSAIAGSGMAVSRLLYRSVSTLRTLPRLSVPAQKSGVQRSFTVGSRLSAKKYTEDHEWVDLGADNIATIGVSAYAAKALGDVVYVELPTVDTEVSQGDSIGAVESVKSASDIMTPVSGVIQEVNNKLEEKPATINRSPEADGWLAKIKVSKPEELEALMDDEGYRQFTEDADAK